jgi:peptidoglycan/LPS O-acetylase OafA/YrhL
MAVAIEKDDNSVKTSGRSQTHELAGIEVLRFLSALAILIWHYSHFFFVGEVDEAQAILLRPELPFYGPLRFAYEGGFWAVQVFWGISGFIFYWTYAQPIANRGIGLLEFAIRRFSRLYPLHIATLMIVAVLQYFYFRSHGLHFIYRDNGISAFIEHLLFASNWIKTQTLSFNAPVWSVSVEILVYFGFFAVVRAGGPAPATALAVCGLSWVLDHVNFNYLIPVNSAVLKCALLFFAGGFAVWLSRQRQGLVSSLAIGATTIALLAFGLIHADSGVILVLTVCSVAVFARLGELKAGLFLKHLAFLGNATYSSYLLHFPIQLGMVSIVDALGYSRTIFLMPVVFVTYLSLVIGTSLAVYRVFEHPAQRWIRDLALQKQAASLSKSSY